MFKLTNLRFPGFFALTALFLGLQASAQFEVSPDHFDNTTAKQTAHRRAAKSNTNAASKANHKTETATAAAKPKTATKKKMPVNQTATAAIPH